MTSASLPAALVFSTLAPASLLALWCGVRFGIALAIAGAIATHGLVSPVTLDRD